MADEKLIDLMVKLAKRLDKVEADVIELKAFVGFIKANQEREQTKEDNDQILHDIKLNTFKDRLSDI
jgi:hypothetical protein